LSLENLKKKKNYSSPLWRGSSRSFFLGHVLIYFGKANFHWILKPVINTR
jgi:hypothetical protein